VTRVEIAQVGEANRRKSEISRLKQESEQWRISLSSDERIVATIGELVYERIVEHSGLVSGCYLLAFFLHEYLRSRHRIESELIVGWVNDGTWDGLTSHGWIEVGRKKVDISLHRTEYPEACPPGDLIILDRIMRPGKAKYTYHRERSAQSLSTAQEWARGDASRQQALILKDQEHEYLFGLSKTNAGVSTYLNSVVPADRRYNALSEMIE
jgi:hypothetical protein